jgi:hypothetical protein
MNQATTEILEDLKCTNVGDKCYYTGTPKTVKHTGNIDAHQNYGYNVLFEDGLEGLFNSKKDQTYFVVGKEKICQLEVKLAKNGETKWLKITRDDRDENGNKKTFTKGSQGQSGGGGGKYAEVSPEIQKRIINTTMLDLSIKLAVKFKFTREDIKALPGAQRSNIYGIVDILVNYVDEKANAGEKFSKDNAIAAQSSLTLAVDAIDVPWMEIKTFITVIECADRFYTFLTE